MKRILLFIISGLFFANSLFAQEPFPFWNDIQKFKQADSAAFPEANQILLIGSSSFTKWTDVQDYFPGYKIVNRGFGGSTLPDLIRYRYEVIFPYAPKQIIMYCGENDFAADSTLTSNEVFDRFKLLYKYIRNKYPTVPFAYISMKPSPSREYLLSKYKEANSLIKNYLSKYRNAKYVDVFSLMLNKDGTVKEDIFVEDRLHMNSKGYAIWKKALLPYLKK